MLRIWRILVRAAFIALVVSRAVAQDTAPGELSDGGTPPPASDSEVLAEGVGGAFTRDAADAYIEALEFTLGELGQATTFDAGERGQIHGALAAGFADLPAEVQVDLANARPLWTQYRSAWSTLAPQAKQEFAYYILALAYGEQAGAQALGLSAGDAEESGGGGYRPSVDDLWAPFPGRPTAGAAPAAPATTPGPAPTLTTTEVWATLAQADCRQAAASRSARSCRTFNAGARTS